MIVFSELVGYPVMVVEKAAEINNLGFFVVREWVDGKLKKYPFDGNLAVSIQAEVEDGKVVRLWLER